jgi:hypothetical protein
MEFFSTYLEKAWDDLLSRDAGRVRERFFSLDGESQKTVMAHLKKMVTEDGWISNRKRPRRPRYKP